MTEDTTVERATFARRLATLKRQGCALLVVGADTAAAHGGACERLLGDVDADTERRRIVVRTDGSVPSPAHLDPVAVLDHETMTRSGATTAPGGHAETSTIRPDLGTVPGMGETIDPRETVPTTDIEDLGSAIVERVDALAVEDSLTPGQLRLCMDSIVPLLTDHSTEAVFRFCHLVGSRVRHRRGIAHVHLPLERSTEQVAVLAPLFDAVIEVRADGETVEHRWHLRDEEYSSEWLGL